MSDQKYARKLKEAVKLLQELIDKTSLTREQRKKIHKARNVIRRVVNALSREDWVRATMGYIREGHHGRFAEAFTSELEPVCLDTGEGKKVKVTFSLEEADEVWEEDRDPVQGEILILSDISAKDAGEHTVGGWRAHYARLHRPARKR